jgi:transcriptional regulator with XRE-family HTH domain
VEKTIGKKIKELRKENNLSQDKLGELVACDRNKIADWERNKSEPKIEYIIKLSKVFNVSSDYLLGLSEPFTTDNELKFVCEYTGLNEKAIGKLSVYGLRIEKIRKGEKIKENDIQSDIIDSRLFFKIAHHVEKYNEKSEQLISLVDKFKKSNNYLFGELEDIENKEKEMKYELYEMQEDCIEYIKKQCPNIDKLETIDNELVKSIIEDIENDE